MSEGAPLKTARDDGASGLPLERLQPRGYRARALSDAELWLEGMRMVKPERFSSLLSAYNALLGDTIVDAGDALDRAIHGQVPHGCALDDTTFTKTYPAALREVRSEGARRAGLRATHERMAAALLVESRLRDGESAE